MARRPGLEPWQPTVWPSSHTPSMPNWAVVSAARSATKTDHKSDVLSTLDDARYWVKAKAHKLMDGDGYTLASLRRTGEEQANLWA